MMCSTAFVSSAYPFRSSTAALSEDDKFDSAPAGLASDLLHDELRPVMQCFSRGKAGCGQTRYATAWKLSSYAYRHPVLDHHVVVIGDPPVRTGPKQNFSIILVPFLCSLQHLRQFATSLNGLLLQGDRSKVFHPPATVDALSHYSGREPMSSRKRNTVVFERHHNEPSLDLRLLEVSLVTVH